MDPMAFSDSTHEWKVNQCLQAIPDDPTGADAPDGEQVTALSFNTIGSHLAVGTKGGRMQVYENASLNKAASISPTSSPRKKSSLLSPTNLLGLGRSSSKPSNLVAASQEYYHYGDFLSHDPEFDYLKSLEIEGKINKISWLPPANHKLQLLSCNDKTIKLWSMQKKKQAQFSESEKGELIQHRLPDVVFTDPVFKSKTRRVYKNAHTFHVNSISINSDGMSFISADDLRVNLWDFEINSSCFNLIDIKPEDMEDLSEVITAVDFHPVQCNTLMYSSSGGNIRLVDTRQSALCDFHTKIFVGQDESEAKTFFSEIIASISDAKFTPDGRYIISRDFLTVKVWDLKMESKPIQIINVHEQLREKLTESYENDAIFDKFEIAVSGNGSFFSTGSYNDMFNVNSLNNEKHDKSVEAIVNKPKITKKISFSKSKTNARPTTSGDHISYTKKILHVDIHPKTHCIAVATKHKVYMASYVPI